MPTIVYWLLLVVCVSMFVVFVRDALRDRAWRKHEHEAETPRVTAKEWYFCACAEGYADCVVKTQDATKMLYVGPAIAGHVFTRSPSGPRFVGSDRMWCRACFNTHYDLSDDDSDCEST